jgi:ABC-type transport system involved in multi-copper enzyme maturation permease subunit
VKALVHAELLKLRSTRLTPMLLSATLGLVMLAIATNVPGVLGGTGLLSLDDPGLFALVVGIGFGVPQVLITLLGVLAFTQEFRYGTASSTYLIEPRRTRVLVAKWLSLVLASGVLTTATLAVAVPFGIALIRSQGAEVIVGAQLWQTVAAGFALMAAYGVIGVALGALIRNQIAAVVGVLIWMLAVEQILIPVLPEVGRWMPWGATSSLLQLGPSYGFDGELLSAPMGGLVLAGYTAAAVALALRFTLRRDVL